MWRPASPSLGRQTTGRPICGAGASSPLRLAQGVERGLPDEFLYRGPHGPGEPQGLPVAVPAAAVAPQPLPLGRLCRPPLRGMRSATSRASGQGPHWAGGGRRTLSKTWSGGHGRWPRCRCQQKYPALSWPRTTRLLWGGRSRPPRITTCGVRAYRLGSGPKNVHWPVSPSVLRGTPPCAVAAYAPGDSLPGHVGPVPASAGPYAVTIARLLMDYYPRPLEGGPPLLPYARRTPRRPRVFRSWLRSAAARRERSAALRAHSTWCMGHHCARGVETWAGASAAAAVPETRGMPALQRARSA